MAAKRQPLKKPAEQTQTLDEVIQIINTAIDKRIEKIISEAWAEAQDFEDDEKNFSCWYEKWGSRTE